MSRKPAAAAAAAAASSSPATVAVAPAVPAPHAQASLTTTTPGAGAGVGGAKAAAAMAQQPPPLRPPAPINTSVNPAASSAAAASAQQREAHDNKQNLLERYHRQQRELVNGDEPPGGAAAPRAAGATALHPTLSSTAGGATAGGGASARPSLTGAPLQPGAAAGAAPGAHAYHVPAPVTAPPRRRGFFARMFPCLAPAAAGDVAAAPAAPAAIAITTGGGTPLGGRTHPLSSPRRALYAAELAPPGHGHAHPVHGGFHLHLQQLGTPHRHTAAASGATPPGSAAFSEADWHEVLTHWEGSSASSGTGRTAEEERELARMVREMGRVEAGAAAAAASGGHGAAAAASAAHHPAAFHPRSPTALAGAGSAGTPLSASVGAGAATAAIAAAAAAAGGAGAAATTAPGAAPGAAPAAATSQPSAGAPASPNALAAAPSIPRSLPDPGPGPWVPDPPLEFAEPGMRYMPCPPKTPFAHYWARDEARTTPPPQPIDMMLGVNALVRAAHDSIPGIHFTETDKEFHMCARPRVLAIPGLVTYDEHFSKTPGETTTWLMRRDVKPGRSYGQIYYTTTGVMVMRVMVKGLFSNRVEWITEEYMVLEEGGKSIVARQCGLCCKTGKRATQYLVGTKEPPPF